MQNINGKELVFSALRHEQLDRTPWVPFIGVHAGKFLGYNATQVLSNGEILLECLLKTNQLYDPDGQPVVFDLQIEAEILGCNLLWAEKAPPSVSSHPLAKDKIIPTKLPETTDGRLPMILDVMRKFKTEVGSNTALYGLICGPLTLASHLRGTEIFMDLVSEHEYVNELLDYCIKVCKRMSELYIEAGMDIIAVVDPVVSQISPRHFKAFLSNRYTDLFSYLRDKKVFSSLFICGDATKSIDVMCQTHPDCLSIDENVNIVAAKKITDQYDITIGGNIPLTTCMLLGSQQDNIKFVIDLMDKIDDHHNWILSPGCDMPYDVPVENVVAVLEAVRDPECTRDILKNYQATTFDFEIELPDYPNLGKPLVEVFTLDHDVCAACGYMVSAAKKAVADFAPGEVDFAVYKFTIPENVARVSKLGIKNLPSLLINGKLKYSSLIPSEPELIKAIKNAKK
ncbi:MAG: uroporphyrinogen decarboxylase family protein [Flexilinea sp.]